MARGMALIDDRTPLWAVAAIGATTGLVMGAVVASLTGLALVWLVGQPEPCARRAGATGARWPS